MGWRGLPLSTKINLTAALPILLAFAVSGAAYHGIGRVAEGRPAGGRSGAVLQVAGDLLVVTERTGRLMGEAGIAARNRGAADAGNRPHARTRRSGGGGRAGARPGHGKAPRGRHEVARRGRARQRDRAVQHHRRGVAVSRRIRLVRRSDGTRFPCSPYDGGRTGRNRRRRSFPPAPATSRRWRRLLPPRPTRPTSSKARAALSDFQRPHRRGCRAS